MLLLSYQHTVFVLFLCGHVKISMAEAEVSLMVYFKCLHFVCMYKHCIYTRDMHQALPQEVDWESLEGISWLACKTKTEHTKNISWCFLRRQREPLDWTHDCTPVLEAAYWDIHKERAKAEHMATLQHLRQRRRQPMDWIHICLQISKWYFRETSPSAWARYIVSKSRCSVV